MYLFQAAVTTIKKYIRKYRHKGDRSEYCLSYKRKTNLNYHRVHIKQLRTLFGMTGDPFFKRMAEKFYDDALIWKKDTREKKKKSARQGKKFFLK